MLDPHVTRQVDLAIACEELKEEKKQWYGRRKENEKEDSRPSYINLGGGNYEPVSDVTDPDFCLF